MAALQRSNAKVKDFAYAGLEDLLHKIGHFYQPAKRPKGVRLGKPRMCYMNSYRLCGKGYRYCEGMALTETCPIAIQHAWCIDENDLVVDPTWPNGSAYLGVCFTHEYAFERMYQSGSYGVFGDWSYEGFYELLKHGIPDNAIIKPVQAPIEATLARVPLSHVDL